MRKAVGADGAAGLGDFHRRVHQALDHLGWLRPRKFHGGRDAAFGQIATGETDQFGGDALAGQILQRLDRRVAAYDQHPAAG